VSPEIYKVMFNISFKQSLPFIILMCALFAAFQITRVFMVGLSGDGMCYAAIAMNMAHGIGSLWQPSYTPTVLPVYYDHPPLAFFLQSLFFRILGDGFYVEKIYGAVTAFFNIMVILLLWKTMQSHFRWEQSWLAIFCWLLVPLNIYVYHSNLLEGTLVVFTTLSAWLVFYGLRHGRSIYFLPAAALMTLAFLTNGLEAFSALSMPFIFYVIFKQVSFNRMAWQTLLLSVVTLLFIALIMLYIPARHSIETYWNTAVFTTLSGHRGGTYTGWRHFAGINLVLRHLYPLIGVTCIVLCIKAYYEKSWATVKTVLFKKNVIFLLIMALVTMLPVLVSIRQHEHYFFPAFPFFVLFFLEILTPIVMSWIQGLNVQSRGYKIFLSISIIFAVLVLLNIIHSAGKVCRDQDLYQDISSISRLTGDGVTLSSSPAFWTDGNWIIHAYFYRYHHIALSPNIGQMYYLTLAQNAPPAGYQYLTLSLRQLMLWKKVEKGS